MSGERAEGPTLLNAHAWEQLLASANPAHLLISIERRMGPALLTHASPDDVLQETLVAAWNDRARFVAGGPRAFRLWLLTIAEHRIKGLADHHRAAKRGGGIAKADILESRDQAVNLPNSATPSRLARHREQAAALRVALDSLDDQVREIVVLRVVEQLELNEIAQQTGLGTSLIRRRLRHGAELLRQRLTSVLGSASGNF